MKDSLSTICAVIAMSCALVVTGLLLRRELGWGAVARNVSGVESRTLATADWQEVLDAGHILGDSSGSVRIVEFEDFECPACRQFELKALLPIRRKFPGQVAISFRHWPLSYHKFGMPMAIASECAAEQGRFEQFHDLAYAKQDSLGLLPASEFATQSGVPDLPAFNRCVKVAAGSERIQKDVQLVKRLDGAGTPTVIVNGVLIGGVPDSARLSRIVAKALQGESPVKVK